MPIIHIETQAIRIGDRYVTPARSLPYEILSISGWAYSEVRGRERVARCLWLDTNVPFISHFNERGFRTKENDS